MVIDGRRRGGIAEGMAEVAVCLGHRASFLLYTILSLREYFLTPLGAPAELFLYAVVGHADHLPGGIEEHFVAIAVQHDEAGAAAAFAAKEGRYWPPMLTRVLARSAGRGGESLPAGSPEVGYMQRVCLQLVRERERGPRDGQPYLWVAWCRPDLLWIAPHLPVAALDATLCHVMAGDDNGGIGDRYALCPRQLADAYLGGAWWQLWDAPTSLVCWAARRGRWLLPEAEQMLESAAASAQVVGVNPERWLQARLESAGVPIGRLPLIAHLLSEAEASSANGSVSGVRPRYLREWLRARFMGDACGSAAAASSAPGSCMVVLEDSLAVHLLSAGLYADASFYVLRGAASLHQAPLTSPRERPPGEGRLCRGACSAVVELLPPGAQGPVAEGAGAPEAATLLASVPGRPELGGCRLRVAGGWQAGDVRDMQAVPFGIPDGVRPLCSVAYLAPFDGAAGAAWVLWLRQDCPALSSLCEGSAPLGQVSGPVGASWGAVLAQGANETCGAEYRDALRYRLVV